MTTYNKSTLATFFQTNDVPTGSDYANLIDSQVNIAETASQSMAGPLTTTELIAPRVSATNLSATTAVFIGNQGTMISTELYNKFYSTGSMPQLFYSVDDSAIGVGNLQCSITLVNKSQTNKFGEIAFNKWDGVSSSNTDTWAFAVDPDRTNTENFKLRHTGADVLEFYNDNSAMRVYTHLLMDGSIGKAIQSRNAANTQTVQMLRLAGGDYLTLGQSGSALTGIQFQAGASGIVAQIEGSSALIKLNINDNGRTIIGSAADNGVSQLLVAGTVGIGILASANPSAALEIESTTRGLGLPRLTTTQKNAVSNPRAGLLVYDTTLSKLCVRTSAAWETVTSI